MMTTQYDTSGYVAEIDTYMRTLTVPFSRGGSSLLSPSPPIVEHPELETRDDSVIASDDTRSPSPEEIGLPSSTNNKSSSFQKLTKHPSPRQDMEQNLPSGSQEQTADSDLIRGMKPHRFSDRSIDDIKEVHRLKIGAGDDSAKRSRSVSNVLQANELDIGRSYCENDKPRLRNNFRLEAERDLVPVSNNGSSKQRRYIRTIPAVISPKVEILNEAAGKDQDQGPSRQSTQVPSSDQYSKPPDVRKSEDVEWNKNATNAVEIANEESSRKIITDLEQKMKEMSSSLHYYKTYVSIREKDLSSERLRLERLQESFTEKRLIWQRQEQEMKARIEALQSLIPEKERKKFAAATDYDFSDNYGGNNYAYINSQDSTSSGRRKVKLETNPIFGIRKRAKKANENRRKEDVVHGDYDEI
ncbi:uncharacterized protein LOC142340073 [Convolutriloba macropyga]|uniref:uncharacterized protein LOC142340073 n=1 Tax=Convolutriloba macropyga TaxID=536237 RepID=UPI003F51E42F